MLALFIIFVSTAAGSRREAVHRSVNGIPRNRLQLLISSIIIFLITAVQLSLPLAKSQHNTSSSCAVCQESDKEAKGSKEGK